MTGETPKLPNPGDALRLKLSDVEPSSEQPWSDDVLGRSEIAAQLTNLVRNQSTPLAISIHGHWGTGKTFLLQRWQADLEAQGFKAIYFNAWEDDFCDDPLLAILGQLTEHFKEGKLKALASTIAKNAIPLLRQNTLGLLTTTIGLTPTPKQDGQSPRDLFNEYRKQRATKDRLKDGLKAMSAKIAQDTEHPLIFIIDELDRCRPTFAIELLERVKHIFAVPNLVFMFGINRDELCKSLQSIYGDIDTDIYLRRFFDMEFTLPEPDSLAFSRHMIQSFGLDAFFRTLSDNPNARFHLEEFQLLSNFFPPLWSGLGLSLRDIDYCVRLFSLVGRNIELRRNSYPWLLGLLITLKVKNVTLYRQYIEDDIRGAKVIDYIHENISYPVLDTRLLKVLTAMEVYVYLDDSGDIESRSNVPTALGQLELLRADEPLTHPEFLSERIKHADRQAVDVLIQDIRKLHNWSGPGELNHYLATLIDLHQASVRR